MTNPLQIVFMGTPAFAVPALDALLQTSHHVVAVYTRADKPAGRGREPVPSPVKQRAVSAGIPVEQPRTLRTPEAIERLRQYAPDVLVVAAYGLILPGAALEIPQYGALNIHPSLLPRHRGPAPVAGAILAGDQETGVSIMLMDEGIDTGPVLSQLVVPIQPDDTTGSLTERLARLGAELFVDTLERWVAGTIAPNPQDDSAATLTRQFQKDDGKIDWAQPATEIARRIRALQPWPGAFTHWNGKLLKVFRALPLDRPPGDDPNTLPGHVLAGDSEHPLVVTTGAGWLAIDELQLEGKRRVTAAEFLRGYASIVGTQLGSTTRDQS